MLNSFQRGMPSTSTPRLFFSQGQRLERLLPCVSGKIVSIHSTGNVYIDTIPVVLCQVEELTLPHLQGNT